MQIYLAAVSRAGRRAVRHRCSRSFVPVVSPVCHTISSVLSSSRRQSAGVITSHSHRVHGSRYWSFLTGWSRHVRLHHSLENSIHRTHRSLHIRCTVRAHRRDSCSESRQVPDHRSYGRTKKNAAVATSRPLMIRAHRVIRRSAPVHLFLQRPGECWRVAPPAQHNRHEYGVCIWNVAVYTKMLVVNQGWEQTDYTISTRNRRTMPPKASS
jgi:hypothetical protein